jgi:hypothetical protein
MKLLKKLFPKLILIQILTGLIISIILNSKKTTNAKKENTKMNIYMLFEYPYSCGTWFNRGKEVCNEIQQTLEKNGLNVIPSIKPFHIGEFPQGYNGEFNIYLNNNGQKTLLGTSDKNSQFFHKGLKSFAFTYFSTDEKTGERNYFAVNPEREDLRKFVLDRVMTVLKSFGSSQNARNYYYD